MGAVPCRIPSRFFGRQQAIAKNRERSEISWKILEKFLRMLADCRIAGKKTMPTVNRLTILGLLLCSLVSAPQPQSQTVPLSHQAVAIASSSQFPTITQFKTCTGDSTSSLVCTLDAPVSHGDVLLVNVAENVAGDTLTISDNQSQRWISIRCGINNYGSHQCVWYVQNAKAGTTTVLVASSRSMHTFHVSLVEISGVATTDVVDGSETRPTFSGGSAVVCGSVATHEARDILLCFAGDNANDGLVPVAPSMLIARTSESSPITEASAIEYLNAATPGTYTLQWNTHAKNLGLVTVALKPQ